MPGWEGDRDLLGVGGEGERESLMQRKEKNSFFFFSCG